MRKLVQLGLKINERINMNINWETILPLMTDYTIISHDRDSTIKSLRAGHAIIENALTDELQNLGVDMRRVHASRVRCGKKVREEDFHQTRLQASREIWYDIVYSLNDMKRVENIPTEAKIYKVAKDSIINYLSVHSRHRSEIKKIRVKFNAMKAAVYSEIIDAGAEARVIRAWQKQINIEMGIRKTTIGTNARDELRSNILKYAGLVVDNLTEHYK